MPENIPKMAAEKYLRRHAVEELTGLSRSTIYHLMSLGQFPRQVKLTAKAVGWAAREVAKWLAERPHA